MPVKTVNHNNTNETLHKNARRKLLIRAARMHLGEPADVLLFPGMRGQDASLIRKTWAKVPILGLERSDVVIDQKDTTVFDDGMEFYRYHFTQFLSHSGRSPVPLKTFDAASGEMKPNVFHGRAMTTRLVQCKNGGTIKKPVSVSDAVAVKMNERRFDLAYLDFVKNCDSETLENLRDFIRDRARDRFVIAIANSPPRSKSQRNRFGEYEDVARQAGASFHRRDYTDSSLMNFAILIR